MTDNGQIINLMGKEQFTINSVSRQKLSLITMILVSWKIISGLNTKENLR